MISSARTGATLLEAVLGVIMLALIASIVTGLLTAQVRLARSTADRAVARETLRTASTVLAAETRRMTRSDIVAIAPESIAIRAFRGTAIPCAATGFGPVVRYSGDRAPDPAKDSVLVVTHDGELPLGLLDSRPAPASCVTRAGESLMEWRLTRPLTEPAALLVFESGSYHLTTHALRYRSGAGGRQPLTPEVLRHPVTRFTVADSSAVRFTLDAGLLHLRGAAAFPPVPTPFPPIPAPAPAP